MLHSCRHVAGMWLMHADADAAQRASGARWRLPDRMQRAQADAYVLYIASLGPEKALYGRCVALLLLSFGQERPDLLCLRPLYGCLALRLWISKSDCHGCMLA